MSEETTTPPNDPSTAPAQRVPEFVRELTPEELELEKQHQEVRRQVRAALAQKLAQRIREYGGTLFEVTHTTGYDVPLLRDVIADCIPYVLCPPSDPLERLRVRKPGSIDPKLVLGLVLPIINAVKERLSEPPAIPDAPPKPPASEHPAVHSHEDD